MINNKFEVYKLSRELRRSGADVVVTRQNKDEFMQDIEGEKTVAKFKAIYHEVTGYSQTATSTETRYRMKKTPSLLTIYDKDIFYGLKVGDYVNFNNKKFKISKIQNINEWNLIIDINIEVTDYGRGF